MLFHKQKVLCFINYYICVLFVWSANKLKSLLLIHMFDGIQLFPVKTDGANNFITHVSCLQAHLSIHHMMINAYFSIGG